LTIKKVFFFLACTSTTTVNNAYNPLKQVAAGKTTASEDAKEKIQQNQQFHSISTIMAHLQDVYKSI